MPYISGGKGTIRGFFLATAAAEGNCNETVDVGRRRRGRGKGRKAAYRGGNFYLLKWEFSSLRGAHTTTHSNSYVLCVCVERKSMYSAVSTHSVSWDWVENQEHSSPLTTTWRSFVLFRNFQFIRSSRSSFLLPLRQRMGNSSSPDTNTFPTPPFSI